VATLISPADLVVTPFLAARRTRNRVSDVDRARLAQWYVVQVAGGNRNPARTLADRYPESSFKTWTHIFGQMRSQEPALLTAPPRRGVAGGRLTDHAEGLLGYSAGAVPEVLRELYEAERRVFPAPVRRERRETPPKRSTSASDADYNRAWDEWLPRGKWFKETKVGPAELELFEDWWNRAREEAAEEAAEDWWDPRWVSDLIPSNDQGISETTVNLSKVTLPQTRATWGETAPL